MKRIVTGVNAQGRSHVVSNDQLDPSKQKATILWEYAPPQVRQWIDAIDPGATADWAAPQASGGVRWTMAIAPPMAPDGETDEQMALPEARGVDEHGFHTTRTIDFVLIFEGRLTLILDEESVPLERGDVVIQQATRHSWKNESSETAILLALFVRPDGV